MSSPSNLYAEKIFAEHPIAMWALDDNLDFLSLLDNNDKSFSTNTGYWSISDVSLSEPVADINPPMISEPSIRLSSDTGTESFSVTSRIINSSFNLDPDKGNFNVSFYFRSEDEPISSILVGYTDGIDTVLEPYTFSGSYSSQWMFISKTFDIPDNENISVLIQVNLTSAATSSEQSYDFYINGISCGQWSEQNNMLTTGVIPETISTDIALNENLYAVPASAYGLQLADGYYISTDEKLLGTNSGVPMVYGAYSVTKLYPHGDDETPSLIIPGFGFLNESGRAKSYTIEMWLRVNSKSSQPRRIFGPIASNDGLYADGHYLTLKIGNVYRSHNVREWNRPMLIQIKYTDKNASLIINGEQVFDITLDILAFPARLSGTNKEQDWLGFYAYSDIPVVEVDCVAIYSYLVPEVVAKRRFVYGQGVDFPADLNTGYNGKSVYIDYKFANYSKNYIYPDIGRWRQGILENIDVRNNYLETPSYPTPTISIDYKRSDVTAVQVTEQDIIYTAGNSFVVGEEVNISNAGDYSYSNVTIKSRTSTSFSIDNTNSIATTEELEVSAQARSTSKQSEKTLIAKIDSVQNEASPYLTFNPSSEWDNTYVYMTLPNFNLLNQPTEAFYGIFKSVDQSIPKQTLMRIENQVSKDYFDISLINGETIRYSIKYGESTERIIYQESGYVTNNLLQVGLNINRVSSSYGNAVRSFFGSKDALTLYIGGSPNLVDQFTGNFYKLGLSTKRNARKINEFFDENGILINVSSVFEDYYNDENLIDENQVAITYDGGSVTVSDGLLVLDGGQPDSFGFPRVFGHVASYTFLPNRYLGEFILDVIVDSYWQDYVPLKYFGKFVTDGESQKVYGLDFLQFNVDFPLIEKFVGQNYDTNSSTVRTYVSFKYVSDRSNADADFLTFTEPLSDSNVVVPSSNWSNTKYEVGDNTIIYIPENIDFNKVAMHIHIEHIGSSLSNRKTKINSLSIAGNAFNKTKPSEVGTRFGFPLVPVTRRGIYSDYRSKNPFVISKSSKPYLHLDDSSGIGLRPMPENTGQRSLRVKVNPNAQELFRIGAMQLAFKYNFKRFPEQREQIFEIRSRSETIKFYVESANSSGTRGRVFALNDSNKLPYSNINFYINGNSVKDAYIDVDTWSMFGFQFPVALDFDSDGLGDFAISGNAFVNNILFYQVSAEENAKTNILRRWGQVRSMLDKDDESATFWQDFLEDEVYGTIQGPVSWGTVLFIPTDKVIFIDPQALYQSYLGTRKIVVSDDIALLLGDYEYRVYSDIAWQTNIITPV